MPLSDYLENKLLDHVFRNTPYTPPTTVYVALFTAAPGEAGGGTEVAGGSYARQAVTFSAPPGPIANSGLITFPTATADWGTITHVALMDAATVGNLLTYEELTQPKVIENGDIFRFPIGNITQGLE